MREVHTLPKSELMQYALEGAKARRRAVAPHGDEDQEDLIDKDIAEIERRIKAMKRYEEQQKANEQP